MVLQSLVDLYEILARKGKVNRLGWCKVKVSYGLVLDEDGRLNNIISLKVSDSKGNKEIAQNINLPMQVKRAVNVVSNFLCDTSSYMFGCDRKGNLERSKKCFETAKELHNTILADVSSDAMKSILNFFENWQIDKTEEVLKGIGCSESVITDILKNGPNLVLMPLGKYATDYSEVCNAWDAYYSKGEKESGLCLVTGENLAIARLHPSIKGVRGGQSMGTSLVSFNAPAFESFEKEQGQNSPVSEYAAFAYTTALNYLLNQKDYVNFAGDTTIVCWTNDDNEGYQDITTRLFSGSDDIKQDDLWDAVKKLSQGKTVQWEEKHLNPQNRFYVLGLSPNAARLSVRFFLQNNFGEFMKNVQMHDEQMRIVVPDSVKNYHFPIWKILRETVRQNPQNTKNKEQQRNTVKVKEEKNKNFKNESVKPQLAGDIIYSILTGYKYPASLYNNIMIRIKAERDVSIERNAIRAAVIKAYLLRNYSQYKEELTVKLNFECTDQAYILGRLFSLLEEIQYLAHHNKSDNNSKTDINTTIKDSYFSSASSTPAVVFPMLIDLAQKHLKKIKIDRPGMFNTKQIELTELVSMLDEEFPSRMTMQEKGVFQIGYYHQTQYRFTKKEDK